MSPITLFIFTLAAFGLSFILTYSEILEPLRRLLAFEGEHPEAASNTAIRWLCGWITKFLSCPACQGFWFGAFMAPSVGLSRPLFALYICGTNFIIGRAIGVIRLD